MVCTDSQSLCQALTSEAKDTTAIRSLLDTHHSRVIIQWVPGLSNIAGNEMADQEAKVAATLETEPEKPSMKAAISFIKRETKDEPSRPVITESRERTQATQKSATDFRSAIGRMPRC